MAEEQAEGLTWEDVPQFMEDLRATARALLRGEGNAASVQTTSLVNEVLRRQRHAGQDWNTVTWANRQHFFGNARRALWQVLYDRARQRKTQKRTREVHLNEVQWANMAYMAEEEPEQLLALKKVVEELKQTHPQWAAIVEHRFFEGLSTPKIAQMLDVPAHTIDNWWRRDIRPLLRREVQRVVQEE